MKGRLIPINWPPGWINFINFFGLIPLSAPECLELEGYDHSKNSIPSIPRIL
jgi:hypothetical protein